LGWGGGLDGHEVDGAGRRINGTIDEEDGLGRGDFFGQLGSPLLAGYDTEGGFRLETLLGPLSEPRTHTIISAQRIAAGENDAAA
jgi:hypothetical protein